MNIELNGKKHTVSNNQSLANLVQELQLELQTIVLELNGKIVPSEKADQTTLQENDRVEIIQFVGGG